MPGLKENMEWISVNCPGTSDFKRYALLAMDGRDFVKEDEENPKAEVETETSGPTKGLRTTANVMRKKKATVKSKAKAEGADS